MKGLLFTYVLTYGGAVVALFNPFVGMLIYIAFAILRPDSLWYWSVPAGNYSRIVAFATLIGWALHGFGTWQFRGAKPIVFALLGYGAALAFSSLFAANAESAWTFTENQFKIILPCVMGMTLIDSMERLRKTVWVLFLCQSYVTLQINLNYWNDVYPFGNSITFACFDNNGLGIINATGAGMAFFLGLHEPSQWRRWCALAGAALMVHVPMFCMSRGGMLGVLVLGVVSFVILPKRPKHLALFALALIVALRLAGPMVWERFSTAFADEEERDYSAQSRLDLWAAAWQAMLTHPITGLGAGQWVEHEDEYGFRGDKALHSTWFSTGAETGFPGLICLAGFYAIAIGRLWARVCRRSNEVDLRLVQTAQMVIASVSGFIVSASFVSSEGVELPYYLVMVGAAALRLAEAPESVSDGVTDLDRRASETTQNETHDAWLPA